MTNDTKNHHDDFINFLCNIWITECI